MRLWIHRMIPHNAVGCPIRRSEDQRALAPPLGFSQRATSFIASRYQGIHQMPFMCRARAQPQARAAAKLRQMSEDSCQISDGSEPDQKVNALPPHPSAVFRSSRPGAGARTPPLPLRVQRPSRHRRCSRIGSAYPCPGPTSPRGTSPDMMAGPASRSRLASRCHKIRRACPRARPGGPRTDARPDGPARPSPSQLTGPERQKTCPETV
jgi:hypothetical protein